MKKFIIFLSFLLSSLLFSEEVILKAKQQSWVKDLYWIGEGEVELQYEDIKINAEKITYDFVNSQVEAEGEIEFKTRDSEIKALHLIYNLKEKTGFFEVVDASFEGNYYFKGEKLEKIGENSYKIYRGEFTSCNP
ncbi:MAG: LptA/OstA family protein, partial [Thermoanaerobaculia bacterium]